MTSSAGVLDDERFARLAIERGIVTAAQIDAARAIQKDEASAGRNWTLGQILVRERALPAKALVEVLRQEKPRCWQCPRCLATLADGEVEGGCKLCGASLERPRHEQDTINDSVFAGRPRSWEELVVPLETKKSSPAVKTLGRFEVLSVLGEGGMGIVYKAREAITGRLVALKVLKANPSEHQLKRFKRESESIGKLHHPDLVGLIDVGLEGREPWIAMEYVPGPTLQERLVTGEWPSEKESLEMLARIARAVDHAHRNGVIHRDLKPGNIILAPSGPKLTDFGLAKTLEFDAPELTRSGIAIGTPLFMSPEQATGQSDLVDARSDVFALGTLLFLLLAGEVPFAGESHFAIYEKIVHQPPLSPRSVRATVSPRAERVALTALQKERELRYPTALAFAEACEEAAKPAPSLTEVLAPPPRVERRSRAPFFVLVLGLAALAMLGGKLLAPARHRAAPASRVLELGGPLAVAGETVAGVRSSALALGDKVVELRGTPSFLAFAPSGLVVATPLGDAREEVAVLDTATFGFSWRRVVEGRVVALVPLGRGVAAVLDRGETVVVPATEPDPGLASEIGEGRVLAACARPGGGLAALVRGPHEDRLLFVAPMDAPVAVAPSVGLALAGDRIAVLQEDGALALYRAGKRLATEPPRGPSRGVIVATHGDRIAWVVERDRSFELAIQDGEARPRWLTLDGAPLDLAVTAEGALVAFEDRTLVYR